MCTQLEIQVIQKKKNVKFLIWISKKSLEIIKQNSFNHDKFEQDVSF